MQSSWLAYSMASYNVAHRVAAQHCSDCYLLPVQQLQDFMPRSLTTGQNTDLLVDAGLESSESWPRAPRLGSGVFDLGPPSHGQQQRAAPAGQPTGALSS